jgi:serine O-acetyltransferase
MIGIGTLSRVVKEVARDVRAARDRDPAARGVGPAEILATWPGVQAVLAHRIAHALQEAGVPLVPRTLAMTVRAMTGVEIHPAATVGDGLFIDHGMGVVIGETAEVGDDVTLYQGVTLGGTSLERDVKRHPTLGDNVIVGAGAHVLGPITVGDGARVGANAVVLRDVLPGATMAGVPARAIQDLGRAAPDFLAYGTPCSESADPMACLVKELADQVRILNGRVQALEKRDQGAGDRIPDAAE